MDSHSSAMHMKYIESFFQSGLSTADFIVLVTISSHYHISLDTWTVVQMTAAKFKPPIFPVLGLALSNRANIAIFMI
jgi:hypothetical protein